MSKPSDSRSTAFEMFGRLLELDASDRAEYLAEHCRDPELLQRVNAMLRADEGGIDTHSAAEAGANGGGGGGGGESEQGNAAQSGAGAVGLLDRGVEDLLLSLTTEETATSPLPDQIGRYRIVDKLGQGGMATVYRAERVDGEFDQTVALKLILPTRQTEHWQERFLRERQILASLQHPNIATLLDGGLSEDGKPYFAMEYIDGLPITQYCDEHRLGVRPRVRLLLAVCEAVSYAHTNLIVHRDLKPGNVLVDAAGQPKLLDFGIAKILSDQDISDTQTMMRALTPEYAAPEQFTGDVVTTAVDVYALGGLLYELLSGRRPFVHTSGSALDIEREVRSGASSFAQVTQTLDPAEREGIAARRRQSWKRLQRTIRGDLEKIALKALRVEPHRRYRTVEALAGDLRRYLEGLPVEARSDTPWYRLSKFAIRHRVGLPLSVLAGLGLVITSAYAVQQARAAEAAAASALLEAAKANQTRDFVTSLFEFADPDRSLGEQLTARQLLDLGAVRVDQQLSGQPALHAEMLILLAKTYGQLALYDTALPLAERATEVYASISDDANQLAALLVRARLTRKKGEFLEASALLDRLEALLDDPAGAARSALLVERGELLLEQAQFDDSRSALEQALDLDRARLASVDDIARDLYRLGTLEFSAGDSAVGLRLLREAAGLLLKDGRDNSTQFAAIQHDVGVMLIQRGDLQEAQTVLEAVREARQQLLGSQHPDLAVTIKELAGIARQQGFDEEAERLYLAALSINESMLGSEHPETANTLNSLAVFYRGVGNDEQALRFAVRALQGAQKVYGPGHPTTGLMTLNVGSIQRMLGDLDAARGSVTAGLDILVGALGDQHQLVGVAYNALAVVQVDEGNTEAAEPNYRRALMIFEASVGANHPHTVSILNGLASLLFETGRVTESEVTYRRAIGIGEAVLPAGHPNQALLQIGLARVLASRGLCDQARELGRLYTEPLREAGHDRRPSTAAALQAIRECN